MKKNNELKKPNFFVYLLFRIIAKLLAVFKFNLKITKNEIKKIKGPYVVLANHESAIDFINLACTTRKRITFVVSNSFYQSLKINPLLKRCNVIPKQQFQTSIVDMKKMKKAIELKQPLVIYPAGLMTDNGITTPIPKSTGKFIKWLNVDVYVAYTKGSYLTNPKWGKGLRKGKIELSITKLLNKKQLNDYSPEAMQSLICEKLHYDAYQNQEKAMVKYKNGNNIQGLENVLYWCPKCDSFYTNKVIGIDTIKCEKCGNEVYADKYGFLYPRTENDKCFKHPSDWYQEIYNQLYTEISNTENYILETSATLKMLDYKKHQFKEVGKVDIKLDKHQFTIIRKDDNNQKIINVPIKTVPILPFKPGVYFEVQDGSIIYRCCLDKKIEVSKWVNAVRVFYNLNNQ